MHNIHLYVCIDYGKYCLVSVYSEKQTMTTLKLCSHSVHVHWLRVMVFNATFNNISVISWRSVLFVDEAGGNHRPVASH
jgi:hypothetical protein